MVRSPPRSTSADTVVPVKTLLRSGYGRFWISRKGRQRVVRPHRYALALELGRPLSEDVNALHEVCDNPICVRASDALGRPHVVAGTQAENLATMEIGRAHV